MKKYGPVVHEHAWGRGGCRSPMIRRAPSPSWWGEHGGINSPQPSGHSESIGGGLGCQACEDGACYLEGSDGMPLYLTELTSMV